MYGNSDAEQHAHPQCPAVLGRGVWCEANSVLSDSECLACPALFARHDLSKGRSIHMSHQAAYQLKGCTCC